MIVRTLYYVGMGMAGVAMGMAISGHLQPAVILAIAGLAVAQLVSGHDK